MVTLNWKYLACIEHLEMFSSTFVYFILIFNLILLLLLMAFVLGHLHIEKSAALVLWYARFELPDVRDILLLFEIFNPELGNIVDFLIHIFNTFYHYLLSSSTQFNNTCIIGAMWPIRRCCASKPDKRGNGRSDDTNKIF